MVIVMGNHITDVVHTRFRVTMFRCDWVDINSLRGMKTDSNGFSMVNFSRLIHMRKFPFDDLFIFASQAKQKTARVRDGIIL